MSILTHYLLYCSYYDNLGNRLEAARMSGVLISALFCNSIVHPQRNVDFATYMPLQLWDGADVFADPYR